MVFFLVGFVPESQSLANEKEYKAEELQRNESDKSLKVQVDNKEKNSKKIRYRKNSKFRISKILIKPNSTSKISKTLVIDSQEQNQQEKKPLVPKRKYPPKNEKRNITSKVNFNRKSIFIINYRRSISLPSSLIKTNKNDEENINAKGIIKANLMTYKNSVNPVLDRGPDYVALSISKFINSQLASFSRIEYINYLRNLIIDLGFEYSVGDNINTTSYSLEPSINFFISKKDNTKFEENDIKNITEKLIEGGYITEDLKEKLVESHSSNKSKSLSLS